MVDEVVAENAGLRRALGEFLHVEFLDVDEGAVLLRVERGGAEADEAARGGDGAGCAGASALKAGARVAGSAHSRTGRTAEFR